jgi:glycosyltransferase involved in cell wall biosynthesis
VTRSATDDKPIPVCYLAPWVDYGGSDKGTIDWFRWIDRDRFAPLLITTQPSLNRRLHEIYPYASEVWPLPEFLGGQHFPGCIFDLVHSRGVQILHIMNSRIGYDLLPDLASLPDPPAVVVQLHVEEPDRSGYVRYVTTRFGNLVSAFSVSSGHLARAVEGYDISPDKIHVIPTGVDAEVEFNPDRVAPVTTVHRGHFNILFPGRLAEQKDPNLMVDVMSRVLDVHADVRVHVVGDGPLESEVRARVREQGLEGSFAFHPPTRNLAQWYAACDLLLMTSVFEGVPYVIYEAMAMGLPIVAPALAGNVELMGDTAGILVDPRDDVTAYARAVSMLIEDEGCARALGRAGRARVSEHFSLQAMGDRHGQLYDDLLRSRRRAARSRLPATESTSRWRALTNTALEQSAGEPLISYLSGRRLHERPLVSVVVPCYNHGHFLPQCVGAILDQDYEQLEVIVVDDASSDRATIAVLDELNSRDRVRVIRQPRNLGPSAARNRAIEQARGRFVLPVDSDNVLLPGAVSNLVKQLQSAGEAVQFIYPNCQYFGTRDDYFQPPSYNLAVLLGGNYCDTCSLIDRAIFDAGFRYAEDIMLGHEDWDFVLALAANGVRGEPSRHKTLLYRKQGFTRSDAVDYGRSSFHEAIPGRHPQLYGDDRSRGRFGRWRGPAAEIKARCAPDLSILMHEPVDFSTEGGRRLLERLSAQTCTDLELIVECPSTPSLSRAYAVRRIPPGLCANGVELVGESLRLVRGNHVLMVGSGLIDMIAEPSFIEMVQRTFWANPPLEAIAFTDGGGGARYPYQLLEDQDIQGPAHALVWSVTAERKLPDPLLVGEDMAPESIARAMSANGVALQWRHAPFHAAGARPRAQDEGWVQLAGREGEDEPHRRCEREVTAKLGPVLGALENDAVRRWLEELSWLPPGTKLLTRHREVDGQGRIVKVGRDSPPGYVLERYLGAIQRFAPPGTVRLVQGEHGVRTLERGSPRREEDEELGHLELAPLPLLQAVERAILPDGSESIAAGGDDGLRAIAVRLEFLGFIEPFPIAPAAAADARRSHHGVVPLLRCLDRAARRHVYRVGSLPHDAELVGELGALHATAERGSIAVWIDTDGRVVTELTDSLGANHPDARELLHWVAAPAGWDGFGRVRGRLRAIARRSMDASAKTWTARRARERNGSPTQSIVLAKPVGYLYPEAAPCRREVFVAFHPVTGDQVLTHYPLEAADMGYGAATSIGFVLELAPLTGTLSMRRVTVPWASRFGLEVRRS